jgi:hypothetical protein
LSAAQPDLFFRSPGSRLGKIDDMASCGTLKFGDGIEDGQASQIRLRPGGHRPINLTQATRAHNDLKERLLGRMNLRATLPMAAKQVRGTSGGGKAFARSLRSEVIAP